MTGSDRADKLAEKEQHQTELYVRSVRDCAVLLNSAAKDCTIIRISVSSPTNSDPGQPDYQYASSSISMQVELK